MVRKFSNLCYVLAGVILTLAILVLIPGCERTDAASAAYVSDNLQSQFVTVGSSNGFTIVYNRANRVMYAVSDTVTLLVNDDGTPMIWRG